MRFDGREQFPQSPLEGFEWFGLDRVDTALPEWKDGDQTRPGQRLQMLGGLRLAQTGQLGQFADRAGALGE